MPGTSSHSPADSKSAEKMSKSSCGHLSKFMILPPPTTTLLTDFSEIPPNWILDRSKPRCKFCDLELAHKRAHDAELPPPNCENLVAKIQKHIEDAEKCIKEDVRKDELERALPEMEKKLAKAMEDQDERIKEAWTECWAIWGQEDKLEDVKGKSKTENVPDKKGKDKSKLNGNAKEKAT